MLPGSRTPGHEQPLPPMFGNGARLALVSPDSVPAGAIVLAVVIATGNPAGTSQGPSVSPRANTQICRPGLVLDRIGRRVIREGQDLPLTRREYDLFEYVVSHPGRVHTREQLLRRVWAIENITYTPPRTVDVHIARLRRKLGGQHAVSLETLRGVGYRWSGRAGV
jgi:DNA-binding response OmpR family regulator